VEAFALLNWTLEGGSLIGPLIGAILIGYDFRLVALGAAGMFLLVTLLQVRYLPPREVAPDSSSQTVLRDWSEVLKNRAFVLFSLSMAAYLALYNQVYLGLPLEVSRLTGSDAGVGLLFTLLALTGVLGQVPITTWAQRRLSPPRAIMSGLALRGAAFLPLLATASVLPIGTDTGAALLGELGVPPSETGAMVLVWLVNLTPLALSCLLLSLGTMIAGPFVMSMIPALGAGRLVGTYYGMYYLFQGSGAAVGNLLTGAAFDLAGPAGQPGLPWATLALLGLGSAVAVATLERRGLLVEPAGEPSAS
jgi:hypothetical protein